MPITQINWNQIKGGLFSPFSYGAVGGSTDDTAAINAAIIAANTAGGGVVYSGSAHLITSPILMKSGVQLMLANTLTCSGMTTQGGTETTNTAVLFVGTSVLTTALSVSGVSGDVTVTVTSASGISIGDMIVVEDNYNFGRSTIEGVNSHLARVMNVAGAVLSIDNPLPTPFPSATSRVRKVTLIENASATIKTIAGAPYQGVAFQWARHCIARDTEVNPVGKDAVYFHSAFGNVATNIIGRNPTSTTSPYGYGCLFDFGASDNILENSCFEGTREIAIAEYARRNIVRGNRIINPADTGINTHGLAALDTLIEDNYIVYPAAYGIAIGQLASNGGCAIDRRTVVRGNTILYSTSYAIREVQFDDNSSTPANVTTDTVIENNMVKFCFAISIFVAGLGTNANGINPIIRNNTIDSSNGAGISLGNFSVGGCIVTDNKITSDGGVAILLDGCRGGNIVRDNTVQSAATHGIKVLNIVTGAKTNNIIDGNKIFASTQHGIYITAAGAGGAVDCIQDKISNNRILSVGAGYSGIFLEDDGFLAINNCIVEDNWISGISNGYAIRFYNGDNLLCKNNVIRNVLNGAGTSYGIYLQSTSTRLIIAGNDVETETLANRYYNIGAAAPAAGTWKVGDIVPSVTPVSGQASGWVCTTAPSTFKAISTIA